MSARYDDRFPVGWALPEIAHGIPTKYGWVVYYPNNLILGEYTDIGFGSFLHAKNGIEIGAYAQLGGGVFVYSVSTIDGKEGKVIIKPHAKIGALSVVMPGVTIGEGAVIGAQSFVNRDIPDGARAWGSPVRCRNKCGLVINPKPRAK